VHSVVAEIGRRGKLCTADPRETAVPTHFHGNSAFQCSVPWTRSQFPSPHRNHFGNTISTLANFKTLGMKYHGRKIMIWMTATVQSVNNYFYCVWCSSLLLTFPKRSVRLLQHSSVTVIGRIWRCICISAEMGWGDVILQPRNYLTGYCSGSCPTTSDVASHDEHQSNDVLRQVDQTPYTDHAFPYCRQHLYPLFATGDLVTLSKAGFSLRRKIFRVFLHEAMWQ